MGIPKFASWISKKYPAMVSREQPRNTAGIYIDMNGIIHPCCHSEDDPRVIQRTEEEKIASVCFAVEEMVNLLNPSSIVYLAMDGVAPRAKMNQQRSRRYMGASTELAATHGMDHYSTEEQKKASAEMQKTMKSLDFGIFGEPDLHEMQNAYVSPPSSPNRATAGLGLGDDDDDEFGVFAADVTVPVEEPLVGGVALPPTAAVVTNVVKKKFDSNCISPGTVFMVKVANALRHFVQDKINSQDPRDAAWKSRLVIISDTNTPGEGEHKFVDFIRCQLAARSKVMQGGAHVVVGLDADLILLCLGLHHQSIWIMRDRKRSAPIVPAYAKKEAKAEAEAEEGMGMPEASSCSSIGGSNVHTPAKQGDGGNDGAKASSPSRTTGSPGRKYEYYQVSAIGDGLVSEVAALLSQEHITGLNMKVADIEGGASKIIDDFIVMATLLGNDFVPRLPSGFCGDNAMDNLLELYVRTILAKGHTLTLAAGEVNVAALYLLMEALAKVEVMKFRMILMRQKKLTEAQVGGPVRLSHSAGKDQFDPDAQWRNDYYTTTSISQSKLQDACESYIEGLRFVCEYYAKTSHVCAWRWFYRYHHAPLASDLALYLSTCSQKSLKPLPTSSTAPTPYTQLMAILPPSSALLLPPNYRKVMREPPAEFAATFPKEWTVDYTAAGGKEHLAVAEIPFANLAGLEQLEIDKLKGELEIDAESRDMMMSTPTSSPSTGQGMMFPGGAGFPGGATPAPGNVLAVSYDDLHRGQNNYYHDLMCALELPRLQELMGSEWPLMFGSVEPHENFATTEPETKKPVVAGGSCTPESAALPSGEGEGNAEVPVLWARVYSFKDKLPEQWGQRPRQYTTTLPTPGLTMTKLEAMKSRRKGNTAEMATAKRKTEMKAEGLDGSVLQARGFTLSALTVTVAASILGTQLVQALVSGDGVTGMLAALIHWVTDVVPLIVVVCVSSLIVLQSLGIAMYRGLERPVLQRNAIKDSNVDWQCPDCLFINWAKNQWCFFCHRPYDVATCPAIFSSRIPVSPPMYDGNHETLREKVRLKD